MLLAFELSGEHDTVPKAEVLACLHALSVAYTEIMFSDRILVIDAQLSHETCDVLSRRLGMTHRIYKVLGMSKHEENDILEIVNNADYRNETGGSFAVRTIFMSRNAVYLRKRLLPEKVGELIKEKGYEVNLSNPAKTFVLLVTEQTCIFCLLTHSRDKKQFEERRPHLRPFFSPGVILPKIARALVSLSGIREKELFLDIFCGTGGLLLEAGMIGATVIGIDVQEQMVRGSKENMDYYGVSGDLIVGDASRVPIRDNCIDALVTDMPYGRSSLISWSGSAESHARSLECLSRNALDEINRVLKPGGKAVVVSKSPTSMLLSHKNHFHVRETHLYRVHKSLNRYITVLEKAR